jgi:hypothetical protein
MGSGRAYPLILVIDPARCLEILLEAPGAKERGRAPAGVYLPDRFGDRDPALLRNLLLDERLRKEGRQGIGGDRGMSLRVKGRRKRRRKIRLDVVPVTWELGKG